MRYDIIVTLSYRKVLKDDRYQNARAFNARPSMHYRRINRDAICPVGIVHA